MKWCLHEHETIIPIPERYNWPGVVYCFIAGLLVTFAQRDEVVHFVTSYPAACNATTPSRLLSAGRVGGQTEAEKHVGLNNGALTHSLEQVTLLLMGSREGTTIACDANV